ncbi:MAG: bifunctional UDP-N-acetylglucosamine diphosphorylase/glucosamine-1-phosphate N-acetyltransferase GlmU [Gammaproteobacteria bacterium]|nr:bifunctional UDP-N-acetylglucosamine diphosphorylase/glucosamine-1-phosphate N-acetyltransferase GlmU [Gammaproteobacteria bacterium]
MTARLEIVVLAAGQGTRMKSDLPKVLHPLAGRPLLGHVIATAGALCPARTHVVYGHGGERVLTRFPDANVLWVEQAERLGTGHAVMQAMPGVDDAAVVLVLYGDVPLVPTDLLQPLVAAATTGALAILTVELANPKGYGRILRNEQGAVLGIVEEKDASDAQRGIREGNTGILAAPAHRLRAWLAALKNSNAQGEYYLTDVVAMAVAENLPVVAHCAQDEDDVLGVNDKLQLAHLERVYQRRQAERLMREGVTLLDPARFDLRGTLECGCDVTIDVGVVIEGHVKLGDRVTVGAHCCLRDVELGAGTQLRPMSVLEEALVGPDCRIGPFARLRPGTVLAGHAHVGNFVELKNAQVGEGSKVNHLSYVGDTVMGRDVNVGAGTITCNYDGANKHRTVIGDRAFIGSDSQLVAPVEIGADATIGAGSTVTRDAPAGDLTLSRAPQKSIAGWKRPVKKPKAAG